MELSDNFNPRSPRGERPAITSVDMWNIFEFQSTLPAGGATRAPSFFMPILHYFNPRSPRGERQTSTMEEQPLETISIHAPRGGSDFVPNRLVWDHWKISIHAPRGGSDERDHRLSSGLSVISIHAPRGGSDTDDVLIDLARRGISIHAPRGGSDYRSRWWMPPPKRFQSTLPAGGATPFV